MRKRYKNSRFDNSKELQKSYTDAEPNQDTISPVSISNDTYSDSIWGLNRINAPIVWDSTTGSKNVVIAVIDTGVDYEHPDLAENIWKNPKEIRGNGIDDDDNGYIDDIHGWDFADKDNNPTDDHQLGGHGTHVAGIIGAVGNNNLGVIGVSPNVSIMATKHFQSTDEEGYLREVIDGIYYAVDNGARIINLSFGSPSFDTQQYKALEYAYERNVLVIAAAGNSSRNIDEQPHYPASYDLPNIISVAATSKGATKEEDVLADFSNYGLNSVDLAAPGEDIYSTFPNNQYLTWSGTSMAVPHVTGAAALLLAANPNLSVLDLRYALLSNVYKLDSLQDKVNTGGILDVEKAYQYVVSNNQPRPDSLTPSSIHIEAENYKKAYDLTLGNQGEKYRQDLNVDIEDNIGGGYNISDIQVGESLSYDFNILVDGIYNLVAGVASGGSGEKQIKAVINNEQERIISFAPTEGYQIWTNAIATGLNLSAGKHELRLDMLSDDFNLDYIKLVPKNISPTTSGVSNDTSDNPRLNHVPSDSDRSLMTTSSIESTFNNLDDDILLGSSTIIGDVAQDSLCSQNREIIAGDSTGVLAASNAIAQFSPLDTDTIQIGASLSATDHQLNHDPMTSGFNWNNCHENINFASLHYNSDLIASRQII
jgi:subtilisin family serine protease